MEAEGGVAWSAKKDGELRRLESSSCGGRTFTGVLFVDASDATTDDGANRLSAEDAATEPPELNRDGYATTTTKMEKSEADGEEDTDPVLSDSLQLPPDVDHAADNHVTMKSSSPERCDSEVADPLSGRKPSSNENVVSAGRAPSWSVAYPALGAELARKVKLPNNCAMSSELRCWGLKGAKGEGVNECEDRRSSAEISGESEKSKIPMKAAANGQKTADAQKLVHALKTVDGSKMAAGHKMSVGHKMATAGHKVTTGSKMAAGHKMAADSREMTDAHKLAEVLRMADGMKSTVGQKLTNGQKILEGQKLVEVLKMANANKMADARKMADSPKAPSVQKMPPDGIKIQDVPKLSIHHKPPAEGYNQMTDLYKMTDGYKMADGFKMADGYKMAAGLGPDSTPLAMMTNQSWAAAAYRSMLLAASVGSGGGGPGGAFDPKVAATAGGGGFSPAGGILPTCYGMNAAAPFAFPSPAFPFYSPYLFMGIPLHSLRIPPVYPDLLQQQHLQQHQQQSYPLQHPQQQQQSTRGPDGLRNPVPSTTGGATPGSSGTSTSSSTGGGGPRKRKLSHHHQSNLDASDSSPTSKKPLRDKATHDAPPPTSKWMPPPPAPPSFMGGHPPDSNGQRASLHYGGEDPSSLARRAGGQQLPPAGDGGVARGNYPISPSRLPSAYEIFARQVAASAAHAQHRLASSDADGGARIGCHGNYGRGIVYDQHGALDLTVGVGGGRRGRDEEAEEAEEEHAGGGGGEGDDGAGRAVAGGGGGGGGGGEEGGEGESDCTDGGC